MQPLFALEGFATPADCAACRVAIRQGSHSFYLASLMLPVSIREPAYAVYAFCRFADDLIDRDEGGAAAIVELGRMLDRIYAGRPGASYVERGFADVVARFAIPRAVPDALVEGLGWDAAGRRYETLDDLESYAVRVAATVGIMMTLVMRRRDPDVLARACDLGVAMQLTNIARDIGEDARNGRIYMPLAWLDEHGMDAGRWMAAPVYDQGARAIVGRMLSVADMLYARSISGVAALPGACRVGINAARLLYREIGREIVAGVDPVTTRAVTTRQQKLRLLAEAASARMADCSALRGPAVGAAQDLIAAVMAAPAPHHQPDLPQWWKVRARSERMVELLAGFKARKDAVERGRRSAPHLGQSRSL